MAGIPILYPLFRPLTRKQQAITLTVMSKVIFKGSWDNQCEIRFVGALKKRFL